MLKSLVVAASAATFVIATATPAMASNEDYYAAYGGANRARVTWTDLTDTLCVTGLNLGSNATVRAYINLDSSGTGIGGWVARTPYDTNDAGGKCTGNLSIAEDEPALIYVRYCENNGGSDTNCFTIGINHDVHT